MDILLMLFIALLYTRRSPFIVNKRHLKTKYWEALLIRLQIGGAKLLQFFFLLKKVLLFGLTISFLSLK